MKLPLEDLYEDILGKTIKGMGLKPEECARRAGLSVDDVNKALEGHFDESVARSLAAVLRLSPGALVATGRKSWQPAPVALKSLHPFNTPFDDMTVNAYLAWDPDSRQAVLFDTGADADPILDFLKEHNLTLSLILLTHTHRDHVIELSKIREHAPSAPVYVHPAESVDGPSDAFLEGDHFQVGNLGIEVRFTPGHSPGGTTFVVHGFERPVAVVGDALFAGSMGGAPNAWDDALQVNRDKILSLVPDTVLCPGHGPMTTVGEELRHNPFYAG